MASESKARDELIGGEARPAPLAVREEDAAAMIGVSVAKLRRWRQQGLGPRWCRLGARTLVYPVDELKAYLASRLEPARA